MSKHGEHARRELGLLGEDAEYMGSVVASIDAFFEFGHSGGSASVAIPTWERLVRGEALTPLTSDPAEWEDRSEMSGSPWWQNRRDSRAMSHDGGRTWWYVEARHPGERAKRDGVSGVMAQCTGCGGEGVVFVPDAPARRRSGVPTVEELRASSRWRATDMVTGQPLAEQPTPPGDDTWGARRGDTPEVGR